MPRSEPNPSPGRTAHAKWHLLLLLSGGVALVYEVLWMRRFAAIFGATTPALAATLAALFFGFTVGSSLIGRLAPGMARPLRAYAILEMAAGLGAFLVELILHGYDSIYPALYRACGASPLIFALLKTALAAAALFIPSFCMGGAVPLLGQALSREARRFGVSVAGLYAANTLGAAIGAWSVPAFWLHHLSASQTYAACIASSILIGCLAWWFDNPASAVQPRPALRAAPPARESWRLIALAALSGAALFVLQVVWTRMFAQVHENSIYSFALVVAVLLLGLAAGAALVRLLLQRGFQPSTLLEYSWILAGLIVLSTPALFYAFTHGLSYLKGAGGWMSYAGKLFLLTLPAIFLPSLLGGMSLPLVMEMGGQTSGRPAGPLVGSLIAWNTAGSILGALAAGFLLPRALGMWMTLILVGMGMLLIGLWCAWRERKLTRAAPFIAVASVLLLWRNPLNLPRVKIHLEQGERLLSLRESSYGIVAVVEKPGSRRIKLNNYYVLGGTGSTGDERLQGHIPLLLHPAPKRVAFLGLGTGISAGASMLHPIEQLTIAELAPEVIAASRGFFGDANLHVLEAPRTRTLPEDARNFLRGAGEQFDVIVGDLFVPWRRGEASLYTEDHFRAAKKALAPNGLFCQWLPLFQLSEEEFNMVAATFLDVFPTATLWRGDFSPTAPAIALVARNDGGPLDAQVIRGQIARMQPDPANPGLRFPAGLWMCFAGELRKDMPRFAGALRNRENQPWLEILGPLHHAGNSESAGLFTGKPLADFLAAQHAAPLSFVLEKDEQQWWLAGTKLGASLVQGAANQPAAAQKLMNEALALLPPAMAAAMEAADQKP